MRSPREKQMFDKMLISCYGHSQSNPIARHTKEVVHEHPRTFFPSAGFNDNVARERKWASRRIDATGLLSFKEPGTAVLRQAARHSGHKYPVHKHARKSCDDVPYTRAQVGKTLNSSSLVTMRADDAVRIFVSNLFSASVFFETTTRSGMPRRSLSLNFSPAETPLRSS